MEEASCSQTSNFTIRPYTLEHRNLHTNLWPNAYYYLQEIGAYERVILKRIVKMYGVYRIRFVTEWALFV